MPYLQKTDYLCPVCRYIVVIDEWTHVGGADCDGCPVEGRGRAFYCTNKNCVHSTQPIEDDELVTSNKSHE